MDQGPANNESTSALEQFRQEWKEEVQSKTKQKVGKTDTEAQTAPVRRESVGKPERSINRPSGRHPLADVKDEDVPEEQHNTSTSDIIERIEGLRVLEVDEDEFTARESSAEPKSALEHYERAVEKESQGSLGDSVSHYRKAYRLDANVDQTYRNKHFPTKPKAAEVNPSNASTTVPNTAHHSSQGPVKSLSLSDLISSYAGSSIPNAEPTIEGDEAPPCHIRKLPAEVLIELLRYVAIRNPSDFVRVALVCKRLAFHVFRESAIWKRIALGEEFGLASQQYKFATDLQGREAVFRALEDDEDKTDDAMLLPPVTEALFPQDTDWRTVFQTHPRIRFTGVYISTVNYTRAGGVSATPGTWASTVHIVTYYRYLRFFRDGTVISLLTVNEPLEVVHHLTKENLALARSGKDASHPLKSSPGAAALHPSSKEGDKIAPSAQSFMKNALRGRWRLCHPSLTDPEAGSQIGANLGVAGDLHIETEGAGPRYVYTMHLSLKSKSRSKNATRNNKLVWKGFWSYNQLTDDWAVFHLRNDKAFLFARVKSYGLGY